MARYAWPDRRLAWCCSDFESVAGQSFAPWATVRAGCEFEVDTMDALPPLVPVVAADPRSGELRVLGCIESFGIGGVELAIDDLCVWVDDCGPRRSELMRSPFTALPAPTLRDFVGTRGYRLVSRSREPRTVRSVVVQGVHARRSTVIHVRFYDWASGKIVAQASRRIGASTAPVDVHVPFPSTTTIVYGFYRLGVHFDDAGVPVQAMLSATAPLNHTEPEAYFALDGSYAGPAGTSPLTYDTSAVPWMILTTDCAEPRR